jgi:hypothetical protein
MRTNRDSRHTTGRVLRHGKRQESHQVVFPGVSRMPVARSRSFLKPSFPPRAVRQPSDYGDFEPRHLGIAISFCGESVRWSPYVEFRTGYKEDAWSALTAAEQKAAYRATSKSRKGKSPPDHPEEELQEITIERSQLTVRVVSREELSRMLGYQHF